MSNEQLIEKHNFFFADASSHEQVPRLWSCLQHSFKQEQKWSPLAVFRQNGICGDCFPHGILRFTSQVRKNSHCFSYVRDISASCRKRFGNSACVKDWL